MDEASITVLKKIFRSFPEVKLAYLFGSRAGGAAGPLSDYDFAVYLESMEQPRIAEVRFELMRLLSLALRSDAVDLVILNQAGSPELKYQIITEGRLLHEEEPYKTVYEPRVLNEYFDFRAMLARHGLTKV